MQRTFTGDISGLEVGDAFEVVTRSGSRPHRDTARLNQYRVVRRSEYRITAAPCVIMIDEDRQSFTTYSTGNDAPLRRT